jgi:hypothetical protein
MAQCVHLAVFFHLTPMRFSCYRRALIVAGANRREQTRSRKSLLKPVQPTGHKLCAMKNLSERTSKACLTQQSRSLAASALVSWKRRIALSIDRSKPWQLSIDPPPCRYRFLQCQAVRVFGLMREIRALGPDAGGSVPVVAMTACLIQGERASILDAGFQGMFAEAVHAGQIIGDDSGGAQRLGDSISLDYGSSADSE